jgi:hypothetical protein
MTGTRADQEVEEENLKRRRGDFNAHLEHLWPRVELDLGFVSGVGFESPRRDWGAVP